MLEINTDMMNLGKEIINKIDFLDIHYHVNPDLYKRRGSALSIGKIYKEFNGGVILKSHLGSTVQAAEICRAEGLDVYPSLVLNKIAGGLNCRTILQSLSECSAFENFALLVHLPTIVCSEHQSPLKRDFSNKIAKQYSTEIERLVIDSKLRSEVTEILKMSKDFPIVISTGHATKAEIMLIIEECYKLDIKKLMLNQPANPITGLKFIDLVDLLSEHKFLWVEQTALTYLLNYQTWDDFASVLQHLPRVLYSSDLGQISQPNIYNWRALSNQWFKQANLSEIRIREISLTNPLKLMQVINKY